jgi:TPR repeat protein
MTSMRRRWFSIPLLLLIAGSADAGDCRAVLRPLMMQNPPDRAALIEAQALCRAEADAGDADSLYQSSLLHLGLLDFDVDRALPLIEAAARSEVSEAQYWLAWQYDSGPLLPDNPELAREWYERAGANEHRLALSRLAFAHGSGELGFAVDARKAAEYRARAERCKNDSG